MRISFNSLSFTPSHMPHVLYNTMQQPHSQCVGVTRHKLMAVSMNNWRACSTSIRKPFSALRSLHIALPTLNSITQISHQLLPSCSRKWVGYDLRSLFFLNYLFRLNIKERHAQFFHVFTPPKKKRSNINKFNIYAGRFTFFLCT
jgi:hypothetical protein